MDHRLKNIKPSRAKRFLVKKGFIHTNTKGTHWTYFNRESKRIVQVIDNNKQVYAKNAKEMIKKSGISIDEWVKGCK